MKKIILILLFNFFAFAITIQNQNYCFKQRTYPEKYNILFNAMKNSLLSFGMNILQIDKKNRFISAEGTVSQGDNIYRLTFTISFDTYKDTNTTTINTLVTYDKLEKENSGQTTATIAGVITMPIPLPWEKVFKYEGSHVINNYKFFDIFYMNFDNQLFEYKMKILN